MVTATMPFKAQTVACLKQLILNGEYMMPEFVSSDCSRVIRGLLQHEPTRRLAISEIRECKWLQGQNFARSLPKYKLTDISCEKVDGGSSPCTILSEEEKEVRKQLQELGIEEEMLVQSQKDGVRNPVMGTYRILLHRLLALNRQFGSRVESVHDRNQDHVDQESEHPDKRTGSASVVEHNAVRHRSSKTRGKKSSISLQSEQRLSFVDSEGFFIPQATSLFTRSEMHKRKRSVSVTGTSNHNNNNATDSNGNTFPPVTKAASHHKKSWKRKNIVKSCILF
jgi:hypothetical protein